MPDTIEGPVQLVEFYPGFAAPEALWIGDKRYPFSAETVTIDGVQQYDPNRPLLWHLYQSPMRAVLVPFTPGTAYLNFKTADFFTVPVGPPPVPPKPE